MEKLILFTLTLFVGASAFARYTPRESRSFECEKKVNLVFYTDGRRPQLNGETLAPNRIGTETIGQDAKGLRYEFHYSKMPRLRFLVVFEPQLNRKIDTIACRELPR